MIESECKIAVISDWDADGVVSAALALYSQAHRGKFPLEERTKPCIMPAGPRSIKKIAEQGLCWSIVLILDIPFTAEVEETISHLKKCGAKIFYFDHHDSTIRHARKLEEEYGVFLVVGKSPTSVLLKRFLEGLNVKLTPRLREFVKAVSVLEGGKRKRIPEEDVSHGIVRLAASISKALNQLRDEEAWKKYVRWVANPLPFEDIKIGIGEGEEARSLVRMSMEISRESDEKIREAAMNLAMSSINLGFIKYVDARGKWMGRGASALASNIYKIVNMPVAVLVEKEDGGRLIIIRSGRGEAQKIARKLYNSKIVDDIGGHRNIAVARVSDTVTEKMLESALRRASFEAYRESSLEDKNIDNKEKNNKIRLDFI